MSRPPVIGVSAGCAVTTQGAFTSATVTLPATYVRQLRAAGAAVVVVPAGEPGAAICTRLDALVLSGGRDVDPARYGATPHPATEPPDAARDAGESELLVAALAAGLPVLAICRGLQLLNVCCGGTLHQHLPEHVGHGRHAERPGVFGPTTARVHAESTLAGILGAGERTVLCHHHQAIATCGAGLRSAATSADGTIEAIEMPGRPVLGVQWHPEEGDDLRLFRWLVEAATHV